MFWRIEKDKKKGTERLIYQSVPDENSVSYY